MSDDITGRLGMITPNPYFDHEADRESRESAAERYIAKFAGLFDDIDVALIGLDILAKYDSAAREAHNILSDALKDARSTIAGSAG